jgi:hypothetical protein
VKCIAGKTQRSSHVAGDTTAYENAVAIGGDISVCCRRRQVAVFRTRQ